MYIDDNYLAHHGIKGMRWGIRREKRREERIKNKERREFKREVDRLDGLAYASYRNVRRVYPKQYDQAQKRFSKTGKSDKLRRLFYDSLSEHPLGPRDVNLKNPDTGEVIKGTYASVCADRALYYVVNNFKY